MQDEPRVRLRTILVWLVVWLGLFTTLQHPGYMSAFFEPRATFHYYLGAKYFDELGPFDLYGCAIAADREGNRIWGPETPVRDLRTYRMVPARTVSCRRDRFTPPRWSAFSRDVSWFTHTATPADWTLALTDKGYNATPFFSEVFGPLIDRAAPLRQESTRPPWLVFNLDLIFVGIAIWIVWRSSGATIALLVLTLALGFFGSFGRIGGNLAQYVWFPWLAAAVAAWRARRGASAGAALGMAAGFQVFPVVFAFPVVITGARSVIRRDREGAVRSFAFCLSLLVAAGSCVAVGSLSSRGLDAWRTWRQKIAIHSAYLRGEVFDIGLSNAIGEVISGDRASSDSYEQDVPHTLARKAALEAHRPLWFAVAGLMIALSAAAVWVVPEQAALTFGIVPMYALLALSPYYYFALALLPFMADGLAPRQFRAVIGALAVLFAVDLAIWNGSYISFAFGWHVVTQVLMAIFIVLVPIVCVVGRSNSRTPGVHCDSLQ
jgi:hypothetical protein